MPVRSRAISRVLVPRVPDRKSEHAVQPGDHFGSEILIEMHQHFRVAVRPEAVSGGLEFSAQGMVVVDLPVEDYGDRAVLVADGLLASADIDDAQSAHAKRHAVGHVIAVGVRAAMRDGIAHRAYALTRLVLGYLEPYKSCYAAHTL